MTRSQSFGKGGQEDKDVIVHLLDQVFGANDYKKAILKHNLGWDDAQVETYVFADFQVWLTQGLLANWPMTLQPKDAEGKEVRAIEIIVMQVWGKFLNHTTFTNNGKAFTKKQQWMKISMAQYDQFRTSQPAPPPPVVGKTNDLLVNWNKGIRRDPTAFPTIVHDRNHNAFTIQFEVVARAQGLENVIDGAYIPTTTDERDLFTQQKVFLYSVMLTNIKSDKGREIVVAESKKPMPDAQAIWKALKTHWQDSTVATIAKDEITTYVSTARLTENTRSGILEWLLFWKEQYRQLDDLTPIADRVSESQRKSQLRLAIAGHKDMQHVDQLERTRVVAGDPEFTYDQYLLLLESRATTLDVANRSHDISSRRARRTVNTMDFNVCSMSIADFQAYSAEQTSVQHDINHGNMDVWDVDVNTDEQPIDDGDGYIEFHLHNASSTPGEAPTVHSLIHDGTSLNVYEVRENVYINIPFIPKQHWDPLPEEVKQAIMQHQKQNPNAKPRPNYGRASMLSNRNPSRGMARRTPVLPRRNHPATTGSNFRPESSGVPSVRFTSPPPKKPPKAAIHQAHVNTDSTAGAQSTNIMAHIMGKGSTTLPPTDIRSIMSTTAQQYNSSQGEDTTEDDPGPTIIQMHNHNVTYHIANQQQIKATGALVDRGANGSSAGSDVRLIEEDAFRFADITGINDAQVKGLKIGTVAAVTQTHDGPVVLIIHQVAYLGKGRTIFSSAQMEHFRTQVNDRCCSLGGQQNLVTLEGYVIPLQFRGGLPFVDIHPPSDEELHTLPHVILTSDEVWDPSILDHEFDLQDPTSWDVSLMADLAEADIPVDPRFDEAGRLINVHEVDLESIRQAKQDIPGFTVKDKPPDLDHIRPCLAWAPLDVIKRTLRATTQHAKNLFRIPMRKHFKSRFPAFNVSRRQEAVATDTFFSDTPAHNGGETAAQLFVGIKSLMGDIELYVLKLTLRSCARLKIISVNGEQWTSLSAIVLAVKPVGKYKTYCVRTSFRIGNQNRITNIRILVKISGKHSK